MTHQPYEAGTPLFSTKLSQRLVASLVLILGIVSTSVAEELKIVDAQGQTRSMTSLSSGSHADVQVTLKTETPDWTKVSVILKDTTNKSTVQTTQVDGKGIALFKNIGTGAYSIETNNPQVNIADVQILNGSHEQSRANTEEADREKLRAMYVAGASVAGGVGIAIPLVANSGGDSNSSSSTALVDGNGSSVQGSPSNGGVDNAATLNTQGEPIVQPLLGDTPPDPGAPDPAPSGDNTTVNNTPSTPAAGAPPSTENQEPEVIEEDNIPDPVEPPAPSNS